MKGEFINEARGETFELLEVSSIGRTQNSVVPVPDPRASRRHALVRLQDDGFWFFDLGSSNGSYLNGRRVTTAQLLKSGDQLTIGDHRLRFRGDTPSGQGHETTLSAQTIISTRSKDVILLVSDIHGFTSLSEKLAPDQLAPIIGTWYAEIELALKAHGANLDKFIGDCVLAYWLDTSIPSRLAAIKTAHAMQEVCNQVQKTHAEALSAVDLTFRTGSAIHLGPVAYGAISSGEFTLLGDAVNLAFRLEALTRELDKSILVTDDFLESWEAGMALCSPCGSRNVKGRTEAVEVFAVEDVPD